MSTPTPIRLILGPPRYFVPICIRWPDGFHGGPAGYQEIRDKAEAERVGVIVTEPGKPVKLTITKGERK